jgi:hypothetical protein
MIDIEGLDVNAIVELLLIRYTETNGFAFITPQNKAALLLALNDPLTATV